MYSGETLIVSRAEFLREAQRSGFVDVVTFLTPDAGVVLDFTEDDIERRYAPSSTRVPGYRITRSGSQLHLIGANGTYTFTVSSTTGAHLMALADRIGSTPGGVFAPGPRSSAVREAYQNTYLRVLSYWRRTWGF